VARWEVGDVTGAVVVVDVIRAFTTAVYAFATGASHIFLVDSVADALAVKDVDQDLLLMGEDGSPAGQERVPSISPPDVAMK
jgi:2-phosphosulfolactate phosphatase